MVQTRAELLSWINEWLKLNLTKVEECANGAVYCQIIDSVHPQSVQMSKVNWLAKTDYEFIPNYKLLQVAFDRLDIEKHIDVDNLIRGKYLDNWEFLQWLKRFFDSGYGGHEYNPYERRPQDYSRLPSWAQWTAYKDAPNNYPAQEVATPARLVATKPAVTCPQNSTTKLQILQRENERLQDTAAQLEQERDFYFAKLREIEILTQTLEDSPEVSTVQQLIETFQRILYKE